MGPSPKQAAVNELPLMGHSANGQQSSGHHVESEERGRSWFSTQGPLAYLASGQWDILNELDIQLLKSTLRIVFPI